MEVGKAIFNILSNNAPLTAVVGQRIYPQVAAQLDVFPFVVYNIISQVPVNTLDAKSKLDQLRVQITVVGSTYLETSNVGVLVRNAFDRKAAGTYAGVAIRTIMFESSVDIFQDDQNKYILPVDYKVNLVTSYN